jgi:CDGSH-type Zn-finger protein
VQEGKVAKITINNNGSVRVEGDFTILDANGNTFDLSGRTAISLCRCGHSENKPFCDGTHRKVDFQSEVKARTLPPAAPKPA